jgi:UDP-N-acetylglucosamine transferase subunit ALG13
MAEIWMSVLLVASVGGHLSELAALAERSGVAEGRRIWVTWRNPQSESLLEGEEVVWVRAVQPRQLSAVMSVARRMPGLLRRRGVTRVVTTGSGLALSVVPVARMMGIPCHFIETATRPSEPSLTGKLLRYVPGTHLYTQNHGWADKSWVFRGSIFEGYEAVPTGPARASGAEASGAGSVTAPAGAALGGEGMSALPDASRIVVTLGTMADFGFRRLLDRLVAVLPAGADVLWQTGCTDTTGLPIDARPLLPAGELDAAMRNADVVIGHCGCGTALAAFGAGKRPLLVPREVAYGEHVDDHQVYLADELARLGLAETVRAAELDASHVAAVVGRAVRRLEQPPPFELVEEHARRARRAVAALPGA